MLTAQRKSSPGWQKDVVNAFCSVALLALCLQLLFLALKCWLLLCEGTFWWKPIVLPGG